MSRSDTYYKQQLKTAAKSGPQLVTITDVRRFVDEKGKDILEKGKVGVVVTFKNDDIEHEELYWLGGNGYNKLVKILELLSVNVNDRYKILGKTLWIVIRHNITIINDVKVKIEAEILNYSTDDSMPNYPLILETYDIAADA